MWWTWKGWIHHWDPGVTDIIKSFRLLGEGTLFSPWSRGCGVQVRVISSLLIFILAVLRESALQWTKPWCCYLAVTEQGKIVVCDPAFHHHRWFHPLLNSFTESLRTEKFSSPLSGCVGFCIHYWTVFALRIPWNNPTQEFLKAARIYIAMEKYYSKLFLSLCFSVEVERSNNTPLSSCFVGMWPLGKEQRKKEQTFMHASIATGTIGYSKGKLTLLLRTFLGNCFSHVR